MRVVTLTLEITDEEAAALLAKFENPDAVKEPEPEGDGGLDIRGVPWNGEYHAATKTKNQDGTWKVRRGHDKDALAAYEKQYTEGTEAPVEIPAFLQNQPSAVAAAAMPAMPTMPTMPKRTVSYPEMIAIFEKTAERVGMDTINAKLGEIYTNAGVTDVAELGDSEEKRLAVAIALEKL